MNTPTNRITKAKLFSKIIELINEKNISSAERQLRCLSASIFNEKEATLYKKLTSMISERKKLLRKIPKLLPSGKSWPKITIVTPSYNQGQYIEETIKSVINQGYPNLEYIVVDGGSKDNTVDVLKKYDNDITYWVSERDDGQSDAINKGFKIASGEIIGWLNSDDQLASDALFSIALAFDLSNADMVSGICEIYQDDVLIKKHISSSDDGVLPLEKLLDLENGWNAGMFFYQPEVYFTKSLWDRSGSHVRKDCFYSMDYELWCRFALNKAKHYVIGKSIAKFRMHPEQKTNSITSFKSELVEVRDRFVIENSLKIKSKERNYNEGSNLKVLMLNDNGFNYGAGIAHQRIASGFEMAGHDVIVKELPMASDKVKEARLIEEIEKLKPNIIICGNFHAKANDDFNILKKINQIESKLYWITHDFWIMTGRCAYMGECKKYLQKCDDSCETFNEYPQLDKNKISLAWESKNDILMNGKNLTILANSDWSFNKFNELKSTMNFPNLTISKITLGIPSIFFQSDDKNYIRELFKIPKDDFVITFSVSSISEERKGAKILAEALMKFNRKNVTLLIIGNNDIELDFGLHKVIKIGYLKDADMIVSILTGSDVFIGPSKEETLGQVFIEAAAAGVPSLGFYGSGVEDAIANNITGLLSDPNADALLNKLEKIYDDINCRESIAFFSKIYANNEFTIEKSFRSFFSILNRQGVIDTNSLPKRINFNPNSVLGEDSLSGQNWLISSGGSNTEGPYDGEYPFRFNWLHSSESEIMYKCKVGGNYLKINAINPIFEKLDVKVILSDQHIGNISFNSSYDKNVEEFYFAIRKEITPGWVTIKFIPERTQSPSESEARALSFALISLEIIKK